MSPITQPDERERRSRAGERRRAVAAPPEQVCDYHLLDKVSITASMVPMVVGSQQGSQCYLGHKNRQLQRTRGEYLS